MVTVSPTDLHRIYIQTLLSRRAMREETALELYKRAIGICQNHDNSFYPTHPATGDGLRGFLSDISNLLDDVGMTLKFGREETGRGKSWVVLINSDPTEVAKFATDYNPLEISFYREIVSAIITSYPANSIGSIAALSLTSKLNATMAKSAAEVLLASFVARGWLARSKRGRFSLGPRAMLELETYLRGSFEDYFQTCGKCNHLVLTGVVCTYEDCDTHLHPYCYAPLIRRNDASCPKCKKPFDRYPPKDIGEKAVPEIEDEWNTLKRKRKRPSRANGGGQDEEEEDELDVVDEVDSQEDSQVDIVDAGRQSNGRRGRFVPETLMDSQISRESE